MSQLLSPNTKEDLYTIIREANALKAHFVVPAWLTPDSVLTDVLQICYEYPVYDSVPNFIGTENKAASHLPPDAHYYDRKWQPVWKLCSRVNEFYESETFFPRVF